MKKLIKKIRFALFGNKETAKQKTYASNHCCPSCGSENVQINVSIQTNGFVATGFAGCSDCEATWDDKYSLIGFDNLKIPSVVVTDSVAEWDEDAFIAELNAWQWDGIDINDIMGRLEGIKNCDPNRLKDWELTVPTGYRNKVSYVEWENPINSMETIGRIFKILAVDKLGKALVNETRYNSYNDDENEDFRITSLSNAMETFERFTALSEFAEQHF